ncbi:single-stranded-DNA-specific exonuclease RecJ, partial [Deltaproteobacteria bacterium OttesenSCG-928-K17]|nr:single-stranded-DNA-specific exonuclease RecJ [Deltaproteobacteria bacterium OttesenSCG-928-K17]
MIWRFREIDQNRARTLADELGQPLKVGEFLAAREFKTAAEVKAFIRAEIKDLPSPLSLTDMDKAVERLAAALKRGEPVAVCGDYDADGLTASALLGRGLKELGHEVAVHIPNRLTDGYGLKPEAIRFLAEKGAKLIVTVDNGISDYEAVNEAASLGLDVIITDHHKLPPVLPAALAVIDPHRDSLWSQSPPAGVGVAFMLLCALKRHYQATGLLAADQGPALFDYLPLVAIGTVADLVPLTGPNRILVRHGLKFLAESRFPGLVALKKTSLRRQSKDGGGRVGPTDIGFRLAPRLNAAGRLGSAEPALELLMAADGAAAADLAAKLEDLNRERHLGQNKLCAEALERLEEEISPDSRTVVLGGEGWPRGLLGLAASKVAEVAGKPTVLFSLAEGLAVGSGRSAGNFNLYAALNELRDMFISFGGHAQAAGLTIEAQRLDDFKAALEQVAQAAPGYSGESELLADIAVSAGELDLLAPPLASLEPFGQGHPAPVVIVRGAKVTDARPTDSGGSHHLKLILGGDLNRRTLIGFNLVHRLSEIGREMDLALSLEISEFKGEFSPSWRLMDFRPA